MSRVAVWPHLDPATYQRHELHGEARAWIEKNCYIDIWIEVLHAQGLDPMAMLPFTLAIDFEGDQWTFFKPPLRELWMLYGIDVQELNVWRPLVEHAVRHVRDGKLISTEADAFYLPDTAGTDYRQQHTKTTIVIQDVDIERKRLGYFHNASYYGVDGEDFDRLLRIGAPADPTFMPLFAEVIRVDRVVRRTPSELVAMSRELLRFHLARRPRTNPIARFRQQFTEDLARAQGEGLGFYHAWAFATVRQLGAAFELAALYLRWLERHGERNLATAAEAFDTISTTAKAFILKGARAVNSKRPVDVGATFDGIFAELAAAWSRGIEHLDACYPERG